MGYIDNRRFEEVINGYLENRSEYEDELIHNFQLLIKNIFDGFKFKNVEYEDAEQDCFLLIFKKLENFETKKGSAFNYFTTVILNNIRLMYTKEKRHKEKIQSYISLYGESIIGEKPSNPHKPNLE